MTSVPSLGLRHTIYQYNVGAGIRFKKRRQVLQDEALALRGTDLRCITAHNVEPAVKTSGNGEVIHFYANRRDDQTLNPRIET